MKKGKIIATSIASIAMCASLIAGGTYALFTSESTVNIAVTSGKVDVEATIGELTLSSTVNGVTTPGKNGQWVNGGTATISDATVTLDKMTPGDTVSFDITVTNHSDVSVQARTIYSADGELLGGLTIDGFGEVQQTGVTLWRMLEVGSTAEVYSVSITLDEDAGNEYQGKSAAITFGVEAVQGNAQVDDPFTVRYGQTEEKFVSFEKALDCYEKADANDVTIDIAQGTYYNKNVVVEQLANKNLTIRADKDATFVNNSANPVFVVDAGSRLFNTNETLTFDGLNFELDNGAFGVQFGSGSMRYARNISIENCSFVGTDNTALAVQSGSGSNPNSVEVSECTAYGIDTFVSTYATALTVSSCTATDINGFVNNQPADATTTVVGCNATVNGNEAGYVVRVNGGDLDVTNSTLTLESKCAFSTGAIVVRGATDVTLKGNTISATVVDNVKGVVATICQTASGLVSVTSDKAYTLSTGYKNATAGYALKAWYNDANAKEKESYLIYNENGLMSFSEKVWGTNNGVSDVNTTIELCADLDMTDKVYKAMIVQRTDTLNFDGQGYTISNLNAVSGAGDNTTGQASLFYCYPNTYLNVSNLKIENATVTADNNGNGYASAVVGFAEGTVVLDNVDVTGATIVGSKSSGVLVGYNSANVTLKDCDVKNSTVTLMDFEANGHYAGKVVGTIGTDKTFTMNNCTMTNVTVSGNLASDNVGEIYGRNLGTLVVGGNVYQTPATAQAAIEAAGENETIYLGAGYYDTLIIRNANGSAKTKLTVKGSDGVVVGAIGLNSSSDVTIDGITFDAAGARATYNYSNDGNIRGYGNITDAEQGNPNASADYATIKNCTFTGTPSVNYDVNENSVGYSPICFDGGKRVGNKTDGLTVENCKFYVNAINYVRLQYSGSYNGTTGSTPSTITITGNEFGEGTKYQATHAVICDTSGNVNWEIKDNKFYNWGASEAAIGIGKSSSNTEMTVVVEGNTFNNASATAKILYLKGSGSDLAQTAYHQFTLRNNIYENAYASLTDSDVTSVVSYKNNAFAW